MSRALAVIAMSLMAGSAAAQQGSPIPVPPETGTRRIEKLPEPYRRESVFKQKYDTEKEKRESAERELEGLRAQLPGRGGGVSRKSAAGGEPELDPTDAASSSASALAPLRKLIPALPTTVPVRLPGAHARGKAPAKAPAVAESPGVPDAAPRGPGGGGLAGFDMPLVLAVSPAALEATSARAETAVPLGSYVKAKVLTGVEANSHEAYPILLQLDYAFVGPNQTRIDMSHCFMVAKAKANLSTERVLGETQSLSCVRDNNEVVTRQAKGYIAGEDSTFGVTGELISNQGRVLMSAVIAQLAKGAGEAIAAAQTTTSVAAGLGATAAATNITGSKLGYIAGKSVAEPASMIAQWYLNYAQQLVPSIAVGSGRDVWIVLLDTIRVPALNGLED